MAQWCSVSRANPGKPAMHGRRGSTSRDAAAAITPSSADTGPQWAFAYARTCSRSTAVASGGEALQRCAWGTGRCSRFAARGGKAEKTSDACVRELRDLAAREALRADRLPEPPAPGD